MQIAEHRRFECIPEDCLEGCSEQDDLVNRLSAVAGIRASGIGARFTGDQGDVPWKKVVKSASALQRLSASVVSRSNGPATRAAGVIPPPGGSADIS